MIRNRKLTWLNTRTDPFEQASIISESDTEISGEIRHKLVLTFKDEFDEN